MVITPLLEAFWICRCGAGRGRCRRCTIGSKIDAPSHKTGTIPSSSSIINSIINVQRIGSVWAIIKVESIICTIPVASVGINIQRNGPSERVQLVPYPQDCRRGGWECHCRHRAECGKLSRISGIYNDDDFDFALVLSPRDVYAYWEDHLDFRQEIYGEDGALLFGDDEHLNKEVGAGGGSGGAAVSAVGGILPASSEGIRANARACRQRLDEGLDKENTPNNREATPVYNGNEYDDEESSLHCDDDYIHNASPDEEEDSLLKSQCGTPGRDSRQRRRRRTRTSSSLMASLPLLVPLHPLVEQKTAPPAGRWQNPLASPDENPIYTGTCSIDESGRRVFRPGRKSIFEQAVDALTAPRSGRKSGLFGRRSISPKKNHGSRPPIKHTPSMRRAPLHDLNDATAYVQYIGP